MAEKTWIAPFTTVAFAANKDMGHVWNGASSAKIVRVYRAIIITPVSTASVHNFVQIWRHNGAPTGGTTVTPESQDSSNTALDANTTAGYAKTVTEEAMLRQVMMQATDFNVTTAGFGHLTTMVPYSTVWDAAYVDSSVQPLTAPAGYGYGVKSVTATSGSIDCEIEFTSEAS